ncbi:MAG: TonB-dependent receptor [Niabella sp.]|nr:TonB-dependent receptor [Niabella sp.]
MKMIFVFIFVTLIQAKGTVFSQTVTLSAKNVSISEIFKEIQRQTGYNFLYSTEAIHAIPKTSIAVKNKLLTEALDICLAKTPLSYTVVNKTIIIKERQLSKSSGENEKTTGVVPPLLNIKGRIVDNNGGALTGASIQVRGGQTGTVTDTNGDFVIAADGHAILLISSIGYTGLSVALSDLMRLTEGQSVTIGEGRVEKHGNLFTFYLAPQVSSMDELKIIGYGGVRKREQSSSSSTINAKVFQDVPAATFDLAIQGRAAGVQVTSSSGEPGAGVSILIRGNNSVNASNQPLYVVDGFPLSPMDEATGNSNNGLAQQGAPSNPLAFINPTDIESVEILKDAAATAIYGSRGANGVVMITTKKGKAGKALVDVTFDMGIKHLTHFPAMMTGQEFAELYNEIVPSSPFRGYLRPIPANTRDRNWADEVLRDGTTQNLKVSVEGGNEKNTYSISGGYYNELGTIRTSRYQRGTFRLRSTHSINSKLSVSFLVNGSRTGNRRVSNGSGAIIGGDAILDVLRAKPVSDDFTADEYLTDDIVAYAYNPVNSLNRKDFTVNNDFLFSSQIKYSILKGLDLNINPGASFRDSKRDIFFPSTEGLGARVNGFASVAMLNSQNYVLENYLTYNKQINNRHSFNLVGGFSGQENRSYSYNATAQDFLNNLLGSDNLSMARTQNTPVINKAKTDLQSLFFRSSFSLSNSKYLATYTIRRDGYSAFAQNHKFAVFQAGSVGWNIYKETFLKDVAALSNLKLRASYGTSGTTSIGPYGSLLLQTSQNGVVNNTVIGGFGPQRMGNPNLRWETTRQLDIGLDLGLFKNRLSFTADAYRKNTIDLLQSFPLAPSTGYSSYLTNVGDIRNQGLEFALSGVPVTNSNFSWNSDFNISFQRSKVVSLGGATINGIRVGGNFFGPLNRIVEGDPYAAFYGYIAQGLQQYSDYNPATGKWKYPGEDAQPVGSVVLKDVNGDNVINDLDIVKIGDPNPDYIFGFNNDFRYKDFTLGIFFQGSVGNDIFNATGMLINSGSVTAYGNQTQDWWLHRWTPYNQHNDVRYPSFTTAAQMVNSTKGVEDGSYVRLKNIRLAYNLPQRILTRSHIRTLSVYCTLNNIITWTKYTGFDPEVNSGTAAGVTNNNIGSDIGSYPRANTFLFGLRMGL